VMHPVHALQPGDALLYYTGDDLSAPRWGRLFAKLVYLKTWRRVSHVAVYIGGGRTVEARAEGVGIYEVKWDNLVAHLRPDGPIDITAAMAWFNSEASGQRYDFLGLFRFFTLGKQSTDKQFCSELATRWYRAGGFEPFTSDVDADLTCPGDFLYTPKFRNLPLVSK